MADAPPRLSVVIPAYDEAPNIRPLATRLKATFGRLGIDDWEILFVENGSVDESLSLLEELHREDPRIKYLSLSRNFGHAGAVCCGLDHAKGAHVVLMDGDQQDPPELIETFWAKLHADRLDVVFGVRIKREAQPWLQRLGMRWFYRIWRKTAYVHVPLDAGNFCLMTRQVVDALCTMRERGRFVPGLRAFTGFRQDGVPFERPPRAAGEAKTSFAILTGLAIEGLLAFSVFPLRALLLTGLAAMGFSLVAAVAFLLLWISWWFGWSGVEPTYTLTSVFLVLLAGANMLGIGVIGEYVGRVYQEVKQRPIYLVRRLGL